MTASSEMVTAASLRQLTERTPESRLAAFVESVLASATEAARGGSDQVVVASVESPGMFPEFFQLEKEGAETFISSYLWDRRTSKLVWRDSEVQQQFEARLVERGFTIESQPDRIVVKW